jgi:hypothetical protein
VVRRPDWAAVPRSKARGSSAIWRERRTLSPEREPRASGRRRPDEPELRTDDRDPSSRQSGDDLRRLARCSSIRFSGGRGAGGARCAAPGKRGYKPSSSPSQRGRPLGASPRSACSATDAETGPRSARQGPRGLGSCPGRRSSRRSTSVLTSSVIRTPWHMSTTPAAGLLLPARLLLSSATRGTGSRHRPRSTASWVDGLSPTASAIMASRRSAYGSHPSEARGSAGCGLMSVKRERRLLGIPLQPSPTDPDDEHRHHGQPSAGPRLTRNRR